MRANPKLLEGINVYGSSSSCSPCSRPCMCGPLPPGVPQGARHHSGRIRFPRVPPDVRHLASGVSADPRSRQSEVPAGPRPAVPARHRERGSRRAGRHRGQDQEGGDYRSLRRRHSLAFTSCRPSPIRFPRIYASRRSGRSARWRRSDCL